MPESGRRVALITGTTGQDGAYLAEFLLAKSLNKRIFGVIVAPTPLTDLPSELTAEWQLAELWKMV